MAADVRATALSIYQKEENPSMERQNFWSVRQYFMELRDAVYGELVTVGTCTLIEELFFCYGRPRETYPLLATAAVKHALDAVAERRAMCKVDDDVLEVDFSEHKSKLVLSFSEIPFMRGQAHQWKLAESAVFEIQQKYRECKNPCKVNTPEVSDTLESNPVASDDPNQPRASGERERPLKGWNPFTRNTNGAERKVETSTSDDQKQGSNLAEDGARIIANAHEEAQRLRERTEQEVRQLRALAEMEARQIREQATRDACAIRKRAEKDAQTYCEQVKAEIEEQAKQEVQYLVQQGLKDYFRKEREVWAKEQREGAEKQTKITTRMIALQENMCTDTTAYGANLNRTIEVFQKQLEEYRFGVIAELNEWRTSLYRCKYEALVEAYSRINTLVKRFDNDAAKAQMATAEEIREWMLKHSSSLESLRRVMVRAMDGVGLQEFRPVAGDIFDSYCHTFEDAENDDAYNGRVIAQCTFPGVELVLNHQETKVLQRATVELEPQVGTVSHQVYSF